MSEVLTGDFDSLLSRPDAHVVLDLETESSTLLVLFGGIAGGVSMPVFEFFRLTAGFPAKKAFLRDPRRGWYQLGIPGVGDSACGRARLPQRRHRACWRGTRRHGRRLRRRVRRASLWLLVWCRRSDRLFSPDLRRRREPAAGRRRALAGADRCPAPGTWHGRSATLDLLDVLPVAAGKTRYQVHVSTDDPLDLLPRPPHRRPRRRRDLRARARRPPPGQDPARPGPAPANAPQGAL